MDSHLTATSDCEIHEGINNRQAVSEIAKTIGSSGHQAALEAGKQAVELP